MNWKEYKAHVKKTDPIGGRIIREMEAREKLCRWFYEHKMRRIAYHISPCMTTMMDASRVCEGFKEGVNSQEEKHGFFNGGRICGTAEGNRQGSRC